MPLEPVLVFGASGHAKVVIDVIERQGRYRVAGIIDRAKPVAGAPALWDYPWLGGDDEIKQTGIKSGIVAIGDNAVRGKVVGKILSLIPDFVFISAVHPEARIARGVQIASGAVVMAGACINPDARIGAHTIINTQASIDHDCRIEDFASIAPGATLGGNVSVGEGSAVCLGASIIHRVSVGAHAVIGAGSVVLSDIPAQVVAYGVPCRVTRTRGTAEGYL